MAWIGVNSRTGRQGVKNLRPDLPGHELICRGTIVCEYKPRNPGPLRLLWHESPTPWSRRHAIHRNADGSHSLESIQGPDRIYAKLSGTGAGCTDPTRISFAWDAPLRIGWLTSENLCSGNIQQTAIAMPTPISISGALAAIGSDASTEIHSDVRLIAFSDHIAPVGPSATVSADAKISTPDGESRICNLKPGDNVLTKSGDNVPILEIVKQIVPAFGAAIPIHLRAPFFGLAKDLVVAANQRLSTVRMETEFEFGNGRMFMEAGELIGLPGAEFATCNDLIEYYQILLGSHESIRINGIWAESLYVGRIALTPEIVKNSLLSNVPAADIPIHRKRITPILRSYERRALFGAMIA